MVNRRANQSVNQKPALPGAFTLVELLIVIGIIMILVALTIGVGSSVAEAGRRRATTAALQVLDQTLDKYIDIQGEIPPALAEVPPNKMPSGGFSGDDAGYYPVVDGVSGADKTPINTVGLYLLEAQDVAGIQDILAGIDQKFVRTYRPMVSERGDAQSTETQPELLTVFDAWGNPLRMVHPRFDGVILKSPRAVGEEGAGVKVNEPANGFFVPAELPPNPNRQFVIKSVRRNALGEEDYRSNPDLVGDSDGGICPGPRPYFYSAGPDGDPSTTEDNVYTTEPRFPADA